MIPNFRPNIKLNLFFARPFFYVGDYIKGNIEINTNSNILLSAIIIDIISTENWTFKNTSDESKIQTMNEKKPITQFIVDLKSLKDFPLVDNDILITTGISLIPFNFRFSEEHSPSFEYPFPNKRSFIRYSFCVSLKSPYINTNSSYYLCLISRPIIQSDKILTKTINKPIKKWKIFDKGETILTVTIPENNFKYDSTCKVTIDIDNTKGKASTKEFKIMLIRRIKYKDKVGAIKFNVDTDIVSEKVQAIVEPGKNNTFEYDMIFREKDTAKIYNYNNTTNPYNTEMDKINFFMPTVHGQVISCDYEIKVSLYFNCFVGYDDRPRIILPIYLVHQLPMDYQLEIQEQIDYENALKKSIFEDINPKNLIEDNNKDFINDNNFKEEEKFLGKNIIENNEYNEEEDIALPSKEAIEEVNKNKNNNNNIFNQNKNKILNNNFDNYKENNIDNNIYNNDINNIDNNNINNINDDCPPSVYESAPIPFQIKEEPNIKDNNNNAYPMYNPDLIGNKDNHIRQNNDIHFYNNQINNINNNVDNFGNNQINNNNINNQFISESPEDFSLFDK